MVTVPPDERVAWLCRAAVTATGVSGCGAMVVSSSGYDVAVFATDERARALQELQQGLGTGPGLAAARSGAAVHVLDVRDAGDPQLHQWPGWGQGAEALGVGAYFALPLLVGTTPIGSLDLHREAAGPLVGEEASRARFAADAVAVSLAEQATRLPPLESVQDAMHVHQAAGMAMIQLDVPIDQALLHLRALAFREGTTVDEIADAIVRRRRRLSKEDLG